MDPVGVMVAAERLKLELTLLEKHLRSAYDTTSCLSGPLEEGGLSWLVDQLVDYLLP